MKSKIRFYRKISEIFDSPHGTVLIYRNIHAGLNWRYNVIAFEGFQIKTIGRELGLRLAQKVAINHLEALEEKAEHDTRNSE